MTVLNNNQPIPSKGQSEAMTESQIDDLYPGIFTPRDRLRELSEVKYILMVNGLYSVTAMYEVAQAESDLTDDDIQEILELCELQRARELMFAKAQRESDPQCIVDEVDLFGIYN